MDLYGTLKRVLQGDYSQQDLVQIVDLFQKTALSYLRYLQVSGKRIGGERENLASELEDLALDCIAPLFKRDKHGRFVLLIAYFGANLENYKPGDNVHLLSDTRRLVVKKTKQELARIFRERDPEGARLLRNIRVAVRYSDDLHIFREAGRDWLCFRAYAVADLQAEMAAVSENGHSAPQPDTRAPGLRRHQPVIPEEQLSQLFLSVHKSTDPVSTSLRKILNLLDPLEQYQNCVPVDLVARTIRQAHDESMRSHTERISQQDTPFEHLQTLEIEQAMSAVDESIWEKLKQYVWRRKLPLNVAEAYRFALRDVLRDILDHPDRVSYYKQLQHYLPNLGYREYRQEHRSVFEYLAKLGKRELSDRLKKLV